MGVGTGSDTIGTISHSTGGALKPSTMRAITILIAVIVVLTMVLGLLPSALR